MAIDHSPQDLSHAAIRATGGKATQLRVAILAFFPDHPATIPAQELEQHFADTANRVSIYRTLEWLEERGLIHRIATTDRAWSFALGGGSHRHVHFTCTSCGQTSCLGHTTVAAPRLPPGYRADEVEVVVHGTCDSCAGAGAGADSRAE
jgi:Fur family ferric uptake transcriptional regulator